MHEIPQFVPAGSGLAFSMPRRFSHPDPDQARSLAHQAFQLASARDLVGAIDLIEKAIRLDQLGALDFYLELRAEIYAAMHRFRPDRALRLYNVGWLLARKGLSDDAERAYLAATDFDPAFLWPLNNLAWMRATSRNASSRSGAKALSFAMEMCSRSDWNCWAFLGTLAAANATAGNFEDATGWQECSLTLAPEKHRDIANARLSLYRAGKLYVGENAPVAAGGDISESELASIPTENLLQWLTVLTNEEGVEEPSPGIA